MTDDQVHGELVKWIADLTNVLVIRDHESGTRPVLPYVMINFTGTAELRAHEQEIEFVDDVSGRIKAAPVIETEWRYSMHAYGESPTDLLRPIRSAAKLPQITESLAPLLTVHDVSQIRNVPEYVGERWEPRAQMDLFMRGLVKDGHLIDAIDEFRFGFGTIR